MVTTKYFQPPFRNNIIRKIGFINTGRKESLLHTLIFQLIIEIIQVYNTKLGKTEDRNRFAYNVAKGAEAFELATVSIVLFYDLKYQLLTNICSLF